MFLSKGFNDYLSKPIDVSKLNEVMERWTPREKRERTAEKEGRNASPAQQADHIEIDGVDTAYGLTMTGGSIDAYLDILATYCDDALEKADQIRRCLESGDMGLYTTYAHAMKGASRSIGARDFGDFAARMEEAARAGDADTIASKTEGFIAAMISLAQRISEYIESRMPDQNPQEGGSLTKAQVETLRHALAETDVVAVSRLIYEYGELPLAKKARKDLSDIENHVMLFDYDKAVEKIDRMDV
jgi:HPt (histidine-containing phosphotransfer) domain-containing protein